MPASGIGAIEETVSERPARSWSSAYHAAWVFPISSEPVRHGTVLVEDGRIQWVGPRHSMPDAPHARVVELGDVILCPGLVNAHTHLDLTALRGLLDGESFFAWIRAVVASREALSFADQLNSARAGIVEGLEAGITTFADTSPTATAFDAMRELGVRGIAYLESFGPEAAQSAASLAELRERIAALRPLETPLVRLGVSPHAPYSVSDALYTAIADFARAERLPLATHIAESEAESALVTDGGGPFAQLLKGRGIGVVPRGRSPIAMLEANRVLGPDVLLIHCVRCDPADIATVARSDAAIVTCPHSNRYFGHGAAPVRAFAAAGVRVGVGTDSMASNTRMDPLAEAHLAIGGAPDAWPAAWELATLGGARALGLDDIVGSLDPGKAADLAVFGIPAIEALGVEPPWAVPPGRRSASTVVAGVERVRGRRFVGDEAGISVGAAVAAARLREWRGRATTA